MECMMALTVLAHLYMHVAYGRSRLLFSVRGTVL